MAAWNFVPNAHVQMYVNVDPATDPATLNPDFDGAVQMLTPIRGLVSATGFRAQTQWRMRMVMKAADWPPGFIYNQAILVPSGASVVTWLGVVDDSMQNLPIAYWELASVSPHFANQGGGYYPVDVFFMELAPANFVSF